MDFGGFSLRGVLVVLVGLALVERLLVLALVEMLLVLALVQGLLRVTGLDLLMGVEDIGEELDEDQQELVRSRWVAVGLEEGRRILTV